MSEAFAGRDGSSAVSAEVGMRRTEKARMSRRALCAVGFVWFALVPSCTDSDAPSPFAGEVDADTPSFDAGREPDAASDDLIRGDDIAPAASVDPTLGGPCVDDEQCDDHVECTFDTCDQTTQRCRFAPDHTLCQDGEYCNGIEECVPSQGCRAGEVVGCDDKNPCTLDRCIEQEQSCEHEPRDADGDGDLDRRCFAEGSDCNDEDPNISGHFAEVCANGVDDNCDGTIDERPCTSPEYDSCATARTLSASGTYLFDFTAAQGDLGASCAPLPGRDLMIDLQVTDNPQNVSIDLYGAEGNVALALFDACGLFGTEQACVSSLPSTSGLQVARLRLFDVSPGSYSVVAYSSTPEEAEAEVRFEPATEAPAHETCANALSVDTDTPLRAELVGVTQDTPSACPGGSGDLLYSFELESARDVRVLGASADGFGQPIVSLRGEECAALNDELGCASSSPTELFLRALEPGRYHLAVSSTAPTDIDFQIVTAPPTEAPGPETCSDVGELVPEVPLSIDLGQFADDIDLGCLPGGRDSARQLVLEEPSDVLLVERSSAGDEVAVGLATPECSFEALLGCAVGDDSPIRLREHRVPAGAYRVVAESRRGLPVELTAWTRPAVAPVFVFGANDCENVVTIAETGGSFQGNTTNAEPSFRAGCDSGSVIENGAKDQLLRLELDERRRVIFDMEGSGFTTLLNLRQGAECPGKEVPLQCIVGVGPGRSYLDVVLEPGVYFVQIDGFAQQEGQWFLEVFVGAPQ